MFSNALLQLGLFIAILILVTKPMGLWINNAMNGSCSAINQFGGPIERVIYPLIGVQPNIEMGWKQYAVALLLFNLIGIAFLYALQRWQTWLPLNPQNLPGVN